MRTSLTLLAGACLSALSLSAAANNLNNNDKHSQFGWFNTDAASKIYMGGSRSSARNYVSPEYDAIVEGHSLQDAKIEPLLAAVLGGKGWNNVHGLPGVELGFITPNSVMLRISDWTGINDSLLITGASVEGYIQSLAGGNVDIKNSKSQFAEFYSTGKGSIWMGGGKSDAKRIVSDEFGEITGGSRIDCNKRGKKEVEGLFAALTSGNGWKPEQHGLEGVELVGLTPDSFTISFGANGPTTDRIMFTGTCASDAIAAADFGRADFKDSNSRFVKFDTDAQANVYLAGGSGPFRDLVGGSMDVEEAVDLFKLLVQHKDGGLADTRLLGVTDTSFSFAVKQNSYITKTFLVEGDAIRKAIDAHKAAL
ncbi:hypothetical protein [Paraferrimonas sedimenticola]|uniref:Uncharacterized protein n=1 Tax=Paraferrimonas sedimenticola TaxID=375674 RepID=A0AA37VZP7_9GAMM|nr:hypothetical protein [Paraferrimonas sedimenticola]GLP95845.1 hypothetical protein GCM10007895_11510 [Paraferrimonas sedimenticola]